MKQQVETALDDLITRHSHTGRIIGRLKLAAFLAGVGAIYLCFATGGTYRIGESTTEYYNLLAKGFLAGHLYLPVPPAQELLALPDPYDPRQNAEYRLGDASLYKGHYYMYWGPGPVIPHLAWQVLTGRSLPAAAVQTVAALLSCLAFWLLMEHARRRVWPTGPSAIVWGSSAGFALGGITLYLVGNPSVWHEPLLVAIGCLLFSWYCLLRGWETGGGGYRWFWLGGILLGCVVASRVTYLGYVLATGGVMLVLCLRSRGASRRTFLCSGLCLAAPVLLVGCALAVYNYLRFDNPFEFGTSYALQGSYVEYQLKKTGPGSLMNPKYIPINLGYYLSRTEEIHLQYPFFPRYQYFHTQSREGTLDMISGDQGNANASSVGEIPLTSVFLLAPVAMLALFTPGLLATRPGLVPASLRWLLSTVLFGVLLTILTLSSFVGATIRYTSDILPGLTLTGSLTLLLWASTKASCGFLSRVGALALFILCWAVSIVIGVALGLFVWQHSFPCTAHGVQTSTNSWLTTLVADLGTDNPISRDLAAVPQDWQSADGELCPRQYPLIADIIAANATTLNPDMVKAEWYTIDGAKRQVLFQHPPNSLRFPLEVNENQSVLRFSLALNPRVWKGDKDGVGFEVSVESEERVQRLYYRILDPRHNPDHQHWIEDSVDLSPYVGRSVTLIMATSPLQSGDSDWAGWGALRLTGQNDE